MSALDLRAPAAFFLEHAGVALTDGRLFGAGFENHVRITFATPRPILAEAVRAMGDAARRSA